MDEGRSPKSREAPIRDPIASIDDRFGGMGRGLVAELGAEWMCHAAADASARAARNHGSGTDVPVL